MPGGMNGFELGRLARERRPQLPVLYATGYSASYAAPEKGADMLAKPYREADLRSKLRGLLPIRAARAISEVVDPHPIPSPVPGEGLVNKLLIFFFCALRARLQIFFSEASALRPSMAREARKKKIKVLKPLHRHGGGVGVGVNNLSTPTTSQPQFPFNSNVRNSSSATISSSVNGSFNHPSGIQLRLIRHIRRILFLRLRIRQGCPAHPLRQHPSTSRPASSCSRK